MEEAESSQRDLTAKTRRREESLRFSPQRKEDAEFSQGDFITDFGFCYAK